MKTCLTCGKELGRANKSGYCTRHVSAAYAAKPEWREAQRQGSKQAAITNPERLARLREHVRLIGSLPQAVEARRAKAKEIGLSAIGHKALRENPEARAKAGKRVSETRMAWCPRELRPLYKHLVYSSKIPAAQAREMVLEKHERDMAEFRRKLEARAA